MKATVRKALLGAAVAALLVLVAAACATGTEEPTSTPPPVATVTDQEKPVTGLPNPASVYCLEQGGELETRSDADGNQSGFCIFPDGSEKNQWDFWRENHPADEAPVIEPERPVGMANPASVYCIEQGGKLETRTDADGGQSGFCIFPDGTAKRQWDFWRENHPVPVVEETVVVRPEGPPGPTPPPPPPMRAVSVEESEKIAWQFMLGSPTYEFDGSEGSLELIETMTMKCPYCWSFTFEFESALGGYGDRTGRDVVEVITPHRAVVTVDQGNVVSAVMDGEWDMQLQTMVGTYGTQEESEQIARGYVLNTPTYVFDGMEGSLVLKETLQAFCPNCWGFIFKYKSAHPGYGDRTEQVLAQVITAHEILVSMSDGKVDGATVDREWDAITQEPIRPPVIVTAIAPAPEEPTMGGDDAGAAMSEEESEELARGFVRDSRTFEFDGIEESLELVETLQARCPGCWVFIYAFDSRQAGYGDRTGQMLAQVITPHRASIGVEQGKVVRAILDGEWDMMVQEMVR